MQYNFSILPPGGYIQAYHIFDFWKNTLTEDERQEIYENFDGLIGTNGTTGKEVLFLGEHEQYSSNLEGLSLLAGCGYKNKEIIRKCFFEGERIIKENNFISPRLHEIISEIHFFYSSMIGFLYRYRNEEVFFYESAVYYCKQQIAVSKKVIDNWKKYDEFFVYSGEKLPYHKGYSQLCIIYEKEKEYQKAIEIAQQAESQGWNDDWKKRINRCLQKLTKK